LGSPQATPEFEVVAESSLAGDGTGQASAPRIQETPEIEQIVRFFRGGDSTHGAKGWHRRGGAIGCRLFPGTVRRGLKMPGHMGQVRRTVQNLQVVEVREAENILLIKGAIPGAKGDYVIIRESKKIPKRAAAAKK